MRTQASSQGFNHYKEKTLTSEIWTVKKTGRKIQMGYIRVLNFWLLTEKGI